MLSSATCCVRGCACFLDTPPCLTRPPPPARCKLSIDPAAPKKKGLVKRLLSKARHPRSSAGHDQLLGDLLRVGPGGSEVLLDSCSGTWLGELCWDKVRRRLWGGSMVGWAAPHAFLIA